MRDLFRYIHRTAGKGEMRLFSLYGWREREREERVPQTLFSHSTHFFSASPLPLPCHAFSSHFSAAAANLEGTGRKRNASILVMWIPIVSPTYTHVRPYPHPLANSVGQSRVPSFPSQDPGLDCPFARSCECCIGRRSNERTIRVLICRAWCGWSGGREANHLQRRWDLFTSTELTNRSLAPLSFSFFLFGFIRSGLSLSLSLSATLPLL